MDADLVGAFFPILAKRIPALKIPNIAFIIAKFFGSGVIIATAFIHVPLPSHNCHLIFHAGCFENETC